MPEPTGWRLLVLPYKGKGVTDGGIVLPDSVIDREALATVVAYVLKLGPLAYKDSGKFNGHPWCQAKDWVLIGRYAGARFKLEDSAEVRIINDDEVIGTILSPDDIQSL
jgi:co-chaperonin GroES (HSP10)